MTRYVNVRVKISEGQKEKPQHAIKVSCSAVSIRLGHEDLKGNDIIAVTNSQAKKLAKAHENGKRIMMRITSKKLKHNTKIKGGFLGLLAGLAARALPMIAKSVRCWCPFRVSLIGSTESDGVGSLSKKRRMRFPSGNRWSRIILKTVRG